MVPDNLEQRLQLDASTANASLKEMRAALNQFDENYTQKLKDRAIFNGVSSLVLGGCSALFFSQNYPDDPYPWIVGALTLFSAYLCYTDIRDLRRYNQEKVNFL